MSELHFSEQDGPTFKTAEDIQQNLRSKAEAPAQISKHVSFFGSPDSQNSPVPLCQTKGKASVRQKVSAFDAAAEAVVGSVDQSDFDRSSVKTAGFEPAIAGAEVTVGGTVVVTKETIRVGQQLKSVIGSAKSGTIGLRDAVVQGKTALKTGAKASLKGIGKSAIKGGLSYAQRIQVSTDDFAGQTASNIKSGAVTAGRGVARIVNLIKRIVANPGTALMVAGVVAGGILVVMLINALNAGAATMANSVVAVPGPQEMQRLVTYLNDYRNKAITDEIYHAFANERDPNGNLYGYDSLTGKQSNDLQHGVTWSYANGISNDTAEIISLATVYFQQELPPADAYETFEEWPFFDYCRRMVAYGVDVVARESAPYSCMVYGGCVLGYRSEGETVTIQDYRMETHTCSEGNADCGQWVNEDSTANKEWSWSVGHGEGQSNSYLVKDGTHQVIVYLPIVFPAEASVSELEHLPNEAVQVSSSMTAGQCHGSLVLAEANLYTGRLNDWFYEPGEFSTSFSVTSGEGETTVVDTYEVEFTNATAIPWCPGELNDGQFGHYDLNCTIYMAGYDEYENPETTEPDGDKEGTGNLKALARSTNNGTVKRMVVKQNQFGQEYTENEIAAHYTKTVALPAGADGFLGWYNASGEDAYGNVAWAEVFYKMDWEAIYGVSDGIKCRTVGSRLTAEELAALLEQLGLSGDDARSQVVGFALACQGQFAYGPSSLTGGPGAASVGTSLDCSSFIQYCYWACGLPYSAGYTASYATATDLTPIDANNVQPGDLRVVYASGGMQGHVQMYVGAGSWIECAAGFGVGMDLSNQWMESRPCHYFSYAGF